MKVSVKQLKLESNQEPIPVPPDAIDPLKTTELKVDEVAKADEPRSKTIIKEITRNNILGDTENLKKRREMIESKGIEPADFAYERAIGRNDSLYSNFIELLAITKRKVGRIVVIINGKKMGYASGFMVSKNMLLTNWHVFMTPEMARQSEVHFFYEYDAKGHPNTPVVFKLDATRFFNNKELDYAFVAVQPTDVSGNVSLDSIGYLFLDRGLGKIGEKGVEKLNIIHHPQGDYKQISIRENLFVDLDTTKIFYTTDTAPGSSGSPVFNDQWQVVGLHHKSIAKMTADEKSYLDKDDKVIPVIDGTIDQARIVWLKNEGIRISVILNHMVKENQGQAVVDEIAIAPPDENGHFVIGKNNAANESHSNGNGFTTYTNDREIRISVPLGGLNNDQSIDFSITSSKSRKKIQDGVKDERIISPGDDLLFEIAKADKEKSVDFSKCNGYQRKFLGVDIKLPQPKAVLKKQVALLKDKSSELKYFNYSVIFNAVRRMPMISAVNVEGNPKLRLDNSKRSDDWLRDIRIDVTPQLFDKFYAGSQLDKGHMARFEDANWGRDEETALRNGVYTCFYTNACPQVVALNRAGGLWGQLEKEVLERGIKTEKGKHAKMTVFNGPIFNDRIDKPYQGVTVPMEFFKVICWLDDNGKLRSTGFKLSQETLVDHIKWDEMMHNSDMEALDIDQVTKFREYQIGLKKLTSLTKLDFSHLLKFDTYTKSGGAGETELFNAAEIML